MEYNIQDSILWISYIIASVLFIMGLKKLSHPDTAKKGNLWAAFGMTLAIVCTILFQKGEHDTERIINEDPINILMIIGAIVIGTVIGWVSAKKVKMTAMPQMVSIFNGMGGICAALISLIELPKFLHEIGLGEIQGIGVEDAIFNGTSLSIVLGLMIGSVSFAGSIVAFLKLDERIGDARNPIWKIINLIFLFIVIGLAIAILFMTKGQCETYYIGWVLFIVALIYGVTFVMPIGGADMPVVISLLNSFTGVAAACGGFLYNNTAMLTGGILVGSSGTILTMLMCKAMNRSLLNVIVGQFGGGASVAGGSGIEKSHKELSLSDAAVLLGYSSKVYIVPGYGLAVAQAQHICNELDKLLTEKGIDVKYAIHPVAGRMPGHMNVLLAEADVPHEKLIEMEEANPEMPNTDVVIVIGANDVVNPAAEEDPSSPIYGMPVIKIWEAKQTIVMKRKMGGLGYSGIDNNLFYNKNNSMLLGDAKDTLQKLVAEIKNL